MISDFDAVLSGASVGLLLPVSLYAIHQFYSYLGHEEARPSDGAFHEVSS